MTNSPAGKKVMVAGHICLDIGPKFPQTLTGGLGVLVPGKLVNVDDAVLCTGGAVSNTGLAMAKLGADVILNGKVGDDSFGDIIKNLVGTQRAASFKTEKGQHTSYSVIVAIPGVDRIFLHHTGTNDTFSAADIDYDAAKKCMLFHFGYPPLMRRFYEDGGRELVAMFKQVKSLGVTTSLDMTLPDPDSDSGKVDWRKVLCDVLPYVDIFLPSIEEVAFMLDSNLFAARKKQVQGDPVHSYTTADYTMISDALIKMGAKIVAIKSGIRGYYLRTAKVDGLGRACPADSGAWSNRQLWAPSYKALQFGSATGAGDATIAGFLCGILCNFSPEQSLRLANTVGWQNVRAIDALSGIEDWDSTMRYINDMSRQQNPSDLDGTWHYSHTSGVYHGDCDKK